MNPRVLVPALACAALAASGCSRDSANPHLVALAQERPAPISRPAIVFRISEASLGTLRAYSLPDLAPLSWDIPLRRVPVTRALGFAEETEQLYVSAADSILYVIDLAAGLIRLVDSSLTLATVGPDGIPYFVNAAGAVGAIDQRQIVVWVDSAVPDATRLWGAVGGRALVETVTDGERRLHLFGRGADPISQSVPPGELLLTRWAETAFIRTDGGLQLVDTRARDRSFSNLTLPPLAAAVAVSPSAHRIYVADSTGMLRWYDRFTGTVLDSGAFRATAIRMRIPGSGRYLLALDGATDSTVVYDTAERSLVGSVYTDWTDRIPEISPDGSMVIVSHGNLESLDPATLAVRGAIDGLPGDVWFVSEWAPHAPVTREPEEIEEDVVPDLETQIVFVQVSSSQNQAWAEDFAQRLRNAGLDASVLLPTDENELFRVVLGPYSNRTQAENIGRSLGRPFWIFSPGKDEASP